MKRKLIVQKYGSSCLHSPKDILKVAQKISEDYKERRLLPIVVVSAMGETTDELLRLAHEVASTPPPRELDMLLSVGERVSMALLSMALNELQCPAISLTGSQAGILTDGTHNDAQIIATRPLRIDQALQEEKIVILAGFQGVNPHTKEITTLGRGGSDTTAIAIACHYHCPCEIFKDTQGIGSLDPRWEMPTTYYSQLSFEVLEKMCFWGAKILHHKGVKLAQKHKASLYIKPFSNRSISTPRQGTLIVPAEKLFQHPLFKSPKPLALTLLENVFETSSPPQDPSCKTLLSHPEGSFIVSAPKPLESPAQTLLSVIFSQPLKEEDKITYHKKILSVLPNDHLLLFSPYALHILTPPSELKPTLSLVHTLFFVKANKFF
ncbi:MAG: aspartate kinase [Bdellovibrio sp.]|nr:MAG: aspartate kinase [Bdellovibrio sp.]